MSEPAAGDLFAFPWEPDEAGEPVDYRVLEVISMDADQVHVIAYGDPFPTPPAGADPRDLRPVGLHRHLGGPIAVPRDEFASWQAVPVARGAV
jgi:hypothetical protein